MVQELRVLLAALLFVSGLACASPGIRAEKGASKGVGTEGTVLPRAVVLQNEFWNVTLTVVRSTLRPL